MCLRFTRPLDTILRVGVQGKQIPMMSADDIVKLVRKLKQREKKQATVKKVKTVVVAVVPDAAIPVGGVVNDAMEISPAGIDEGTSSPMMMPPPQARPSAFDDDLIISKQLCDIKQPDFEVESCLSVRFRQSDEKVFAPDLLLQMGLFKTVLQANHAVLQMVENGTIKDLDSIEFDDQFRSVSARSLVLMSFRHAVKLLHRLGVRTVEDDVILPEIEMDGASGDAQDGVMPEIEMAVASDIMPDIEAAAASVIVPEIEISVPSDAALDVVMSQIEMEVASSVIMPASSVIMPQIEVVVASNVTPDVVKNRVRLRKVPASVLKTISGFENLDDSCLEGKVVRQVEPEQVDEKGKDIGGNWVIPDGVSACTGDEAKFCLRWANNPNNVNKDIAKSLTYIDSGHSSVS